MAEEVVPKRGQEDTVVVAEEQVQAEVGVVAIQPTLLSNKLATLCQEAIIVSVVARMDIGQALVL